MIRPFRTFAALGLASACLLAADPGVKLPAYKKTVLKNGLTVLLMEQTKVPLVNVQLTLRSGSVQDPAGKEGLASLTAELLRSGTKTRSNAQISEALDTLGATYGARVIPDATLVSAEFMQKNAAEGLELFADTLLQPAFPEDEVAKLRQRRIDGVRAAKDSAQGVLMTYAAGFLYAGHPYGRPLGGDEKSLAGLTRGDAAAFHAAHFTPSNAILTIVGDFKTADMETLVKARFGAWSGAKAPVAALPKPAPVKGRRLMLVDKPDATQTYFTFGSLAVGQDHPDRVALQVVNALFGERFTSRINTALRIKSGLTYGATSRFNQQLAGGTFAISSFTANATTERALDLALETLKEFREKGITDAELASAKVYLKGTLPPAKLETGEQLAGLLSQLQLYHQTDAEVNAFYAKVDALSLTEANRVIRAHFPEQDLAFVLIGKASEIEACAKKLAPAVVTRSISAPGF